MKAFLPLFVLLSTLAPSSGVSTPGQPPPKPAWQWTDDERMTARTVKSAHHPISAESTSASGDRTHFVLDGSRNAELFMPSELYNSLTYGLWEDDRTRSEARSRYKPAIQKFGWDEAVFWSTLEKLDRRHQELQRRLLSRDLKPAEGERLNIEACNARLMAFRAAKATFGADKFLEFLYTAVAPGISIPARIGSDEEQRLRYVEGGCQ